jgi:TonB family protein
MSPELILWNVTHLTWQWIALVAVGMSLPYAFRLREPRGVLIYLQTLLLAVVLLPVLQPWTRPVYFSFNLAPVAGVPAGGGEVTTGNGWEWQQYVLGAMLAGTALRLLWLTLGLVRLRYYRASARPVTSKAIDDALDATGAKAAVRESSEVGGPVTFGFLRPLVLLPPGVQALPAEAQFAVVAHELLHVKRGDWLYTLIEEGVTAALWWNPAVWLLVGRIRLVREQLIDRSVVALTDSPQPYVQALLTLADANLRVRLAPNFLRRRHLAVRIQTLLSEVTMSRTRLIATYSIITALATATAYLSTTAFPLQAAPQFEASGNNRGVTGAEVVLRKAPVYPSVAKQKGIEGTVIVEATIAENGTVSDARVLSGPQELRSAALEAVLQWQFKNGSVATVTINFTLQKDAPPAAASLPKLERIAFNGLPDEMAETLRARLAHLEGRPVNATEITQIVRGVSPSLTIAVQEAAGGATAVISNGNPFEKGDTPQIRIGGNVQSAKLANKVTPAYPIEAKAARIQGTVRFAALIAADGRVKALHLESGHPLLADSAMKAVQQWVYQPTLLNGNPVEVITAIDVNYTLRP